MKNQVMSHQEVVDMVTEDIQKSFGGREYSEIQKKVLIELIEIYGQKNFRRIAKKLIQEGTSKPFPIHFKTQLQNLPASEKPRATFADKATPNICQTCMNTGKVFIQKQFLTHNNLPVVALCYCPEGLREDENASGLPRFDLSQMGLVDTFPTHLFVNSEPQRSFGAICFGDLIQENNHIVTHWRKIQENSRDYWRQEIQKNKTVQNDR